MYKNTDELQQIPQIKRIQIKASCSKLRKSKLRHLVRILYTFVFYSFLFKEVRDLIFSFSI